MGLPWDSEKLLTKSIWLIFPVVRQEEVHSRVTKRSEADVGEDEVGLSEDEAGHHPLPLPRHVVLAPPDLVDSRDVAEGEVEVAGDHLSQVVGPSNQGILGNSKDRFSSQLTDSNWEQRCKN